MREAPANHEREPTVTTATDAYDPAADPNDPAPGIPDAQLQPDELDARRRNRAGYEHRKENQRLKELEAENTDLKGRLGSYERREALDKAKAELNATGPLAAFLKVYDGEPTADAIRKAISEDPDFSGLITIPPDPVDVAREEQARVASQMAGSDAPQLGQLTAKVVGEWPMDKQILFMKEHRDAWDFLANNPKESVAAPVGWA